METKEKFALAQKKLKCKKFEYSNINKCQTKMLTFKIEKGLTSPIFCQFTQQNLNI